MRLALALAAIIKNATPVIEAALTRLPIVNFNCVPPVIVRLTLLQRGPNGSKRRACVGPNCSQPTPHRYPAHAAGSVEDDSVMNSTATTRDCRLWMVTRPWMVARNTILYSVRA